MLLLGREERCLLFRKSLIEVVRIALNLSHIENNLLQTQSNDNQFSQLIMHLLVCVPFRVQPTMEIALFHALHEC